MPNGPSIQRRPVMVNEKEKPDATTRTRQVRSALLGEMEQPSTEGKVNKHCLALEDTGGADQEVLGQSIVQILRSLQSDLGETSNDTNVSVLEAGGSRNKKGTILSMLEWMGAFIWYDAQLAKLASAAPFTKRGTPRTRVATVLLDRLLDRLLDGEVSNDEPSPVIKRRRSPLGSAEDLPPLRSGPGAFMAEQRTKEGGPSLTRSAEGIKLLVDEGRPSQSRFLDSLASENIALPLEISALGFQLDLECDAVPSEPVAAQVGHLARAIRQWLGQLGLEDTSFMVYDAVDLSGNSLDRLYSNEWLDMWIITAAMELADKPPWVRYGLSILLEERKDDGIIPVTKPFGFWRK
ncbi:hypothetical protein B0T24DRAFT_596593 [Lasiosphaeria ovina]|uniref:Uncharacterized protein n=1 Tax=Lasiosphaeria ovina TaxID=92902 RepID=A0AAE0JYG0_9PEZI|nr:hypothetical protein B0T24DRAFT_596593 [Lasiosphaeria ovina]